MADVLLERQALVDFRIDRCIEESGVAVVQIEADGLRLAETGRQVDALIALPQPRSRIALAAETRAAGVASLLRMTPTSTLIAVLVWLRAIDRISVNVRAFDGFFATGR